MAEGGRRHSKLKKIEVGKKLRVNRWDKKENVVRKESNEKRDIIVK